MSNKKQSTLAGFFKKPSKPETGLLTPTPSSSQPPSSQPPSSPTTPSKVDLEEKENDFNMPPRKRRRWLNSDDEELEMPVCSVLDAVARAKAKRPPPTLQRESSSKASTHVIHDKQERLMSEGYEWLKPGNVKDADGNKEGTPNYNPRTLYIPPSVKSKFSPFEGQFWNFKAQNFDSVLFFQKGKFYELYEEDAALAHSLFDWKMSSRGLRMAGVPDYTFDLWAAKFVAKGYRVARVDQMESILAKEMRDRTTEKKEKIVRRELTQVLTQGSLVDEAMLISDMSTYMMAIKELDCDTDNAIPSFAAVFTDAAIGHIRYSHFKDDAARTKLDTLLSQVKPREVILEKGQLSPASLKTIKGAVSANTTSIWLKSETEFWDDDRTRQELMEAKYFDDAIITGMGSAISAFGGLIWYLRNILLDKEILSLGNIESYDPLQSQTSLVLDGQSLVNLEIFANTWDGSSMGTLFSILQHCITPFGKRLLKLWVCHPLQNVKDINERLDAIDYLRENHDVQAAIRRGFKLPDLERMLSRLHYGRCKLTDFLKLLKGCKQMVDVMDELKVDNVLLNRLVSAAPDLHEKIEYWQSAFDWDEAESSKDENGKQLPGKFVPIAGVEAEFDASLRCMEEIESQFEPLLREYSKKLKSSKLAYKNLGQSKELYQIEVPVSIKVPADWEQLSATKTVTRYWSPAVSSLVRQLLEAQETHRAVVEQMESRYYKRFDEDYREWCAMINIIARIDCLYSLTISSSSLSEPNCRPTFIESDQTSINFTELRHPVSTTTFIPNDVHLGGDTQNVSLLTGPNMAGKSTLLRSTCVAVLLAQLGHYVPASSAILTPIDQLFVRTGGARDNISERQSTFMVELAETSTILRNATSRSLVILDELGRGTSTYDGMAIAYAVLHHLLTETQCIGTFSTHYSSLSAEFQTHPNVKLEHMSFLEENEEVVFLYKLKHGQCSHSHGVNVARMAGLPDSILQSAKQAALEVPVPESDVPLGLEMDLCRDDLTAGQVIKLLDYVRNVLHDLDGRSIL